MENVSAGFAGKIAEIENNKYKIYHVNKDSVFLCKLETSKLDLVVKPMALFLEEIATGRCKLTVPELPLEIDKERMTENELKIYQDHKLFITDVEKLYGPDYMDLYLRTRSEELRSLISEHGTTSPTAWKTIRLFLQSGKCDEGLIDQRLRHKLTKKYNYTKKTGRPYMEGTVTRGLVLTEELEAIFKQYTNMFLRNKSMTILTAYQLMIAREFSYCSDDGVMQPYPVAERPTENQFYYYVKTHTSKEVRDIATLGAKEVRNNNRVLVGSSRTEVIRPGAMIEIDTLEADISLVSEADRTQCIGRGILYMAIDTLTGAIVAVSAGFENNSVTGLTSLFMNHFDDKQDFAGKYGVAFSSNLWPSNFLPEAFRTDYGSDYISEPTRKICRKIGINLEDVPPGTGSLKAEIEQSFHQFQMSYRPFADGKGLITKRYDSNHHKDACLTISEFNQMVITFVVHHNQKADLSRVLGKELIEQGIPAIPIKLWEYYAQRNGAPEPIVPDKRTELYFNLLLDDKASLSRDGITFRGLKYMNDTSELNSRMYKAGAKREPIQIKYDPRSVDSIYYINAESRYVEAHLNEKKEAMESFAGLTFVQYEQYNKKKNLMKEEMKNNNLVVDISRNRAIGAIIDSAASLTPPASKTKTKNMREAREQEKQAVNYDNRISRRLNTGESGEAIEEIEVEVETEQHGLELKPYESPEEARLVAMQNYYDVD